MTMQVKTWQTYFNRPVAEILARKDVEIPDVEGNVVRIPCDQLAQKKENTIYEINALIEHLVQFGQGIHIICSSNNRWLASTINKIIPNWWRGIDFVYFYGERIWCLYPKFAVNRPVGLPWLKTTYLSDWKCNNLFEIYYKFIEPTREMIKRDDSIEIDWSGAFTYISLTKRYGTCTRYLEGEHHVVQSTRKVTIAFLSIVSLFHSLSVFGSDVSIINS